MSTMDRFIEATAPILAECLKGTCIKATYRRTLEGGEVRLRLDFYSAVMFDEDHVPLTFDQGKAEEVRALVMRFRDELLNCARGISKFAPETPDIERLNMVVK